MHIFNHKLHQDMCNHNLNFLNTLLHQLLDYHLHHEYYSELLTILHRKHSKNYSRICKSYGCIPIFFKPQICTFGIVYSANFSQNILLHGYRTLLNELREGIYCSILISIAHKSSYSLKIVLQLLSSFIWGRFLD